ncbi:hypothetical protein [Actinokineospora sp. UTMC 2448]|uniref:hypothetical protein n=1 Tax=Actinokineospora sp. UTMC 2448 TaxID=2268449 RepID=UPI0021640122|nr:hypothetical protein [Actinokineospora sp. UTMC 2448]UVS81057.1 hypothetical protein Actkin_04811 [Actinokineospora sp. UTMC 2448]
MSAPQRPGSPPPWPPPPPRHGGPGATEWIPRVQQPRRDEPIRFEEPPPGERPPNPGATWALRIVGLVTVAVVSGFVWALLQGDAPASDPTAGGDTTTEAPAGRFAFTPHEDMADPRHDKDCAANAYDDVQKFLRKNACVDLTRALYTSKPPGQDKTIYTWVAVVEMPTEELASELHALAETDNTGNVNDPLRAEIVTVKGLESLGRGGYFSQRNGPHVIIVESDWAPAGKRTAEEDKFLTEVSADAVRFGVEFAQG